MEIWDAYLADGTLAGRDLARGESIPKGLCHLVSEIVVRHTDGDYLLMQQDLCKPLFRAFLSERRAFKAHFTNHTSESAALWRHFLFAISLFSFNLGSIIDLVISKFCLLQGRGVYA